jgi:hypothetical protein
MITKDMLESWRQAKNLAVVSLSTDPDIIVAIQEMYIEAKQLRRDNLRLLDRQDLFDALLEYVGGSAKDHYLTVEMEELLDLIRGYCDDLNIDLEKHNV